MGEFSPWHLLILAGVFVLLFGAKRLPDGARSLGRSLRIFKTEIKGLNDDDTAPADAAAAQQAQQAPQAQLPAAPAAPAVPAAPPATPTAEPVQQQHEAR
jgi:sec-independent protein translocase protein TatA